MKTSIWFEIHVTTFKFSNQVVISHRVFILEDVFFRNSYFQSIRVVSIFDLNNIVSSICFNELGLEVRVSKENIFKYKYPMTYNDLVAKLKGRYVDFKPDR